MSIRGPIAGVVLALSVILTSCQLSDSTPAPSGAQLGTTAPRVMEGGKVIVLDTAATDQVASVPIGSHLLNAELKAPCRIVISVIRSHASGIPTFLYESTDLSEAFADYIKTQSLLQKATREEVRLKDLVAHEAAAGKELFDSQTDVAQLQQSLAAAERRIRLAGLDVERTLRMAPGTVMLVADVPESQLGHLAPGDAARIVFNSFPTEKFVSKVVSVGDVVDPLTRSVKVQVTLPNKDGRLIAGLFGQMILGIRQQSASTVPASGIFTALGKTFLFVEKSPGCFERREVVVGLQGNDWVEVVQGVQPHERVVAKGTMLLKALSFGY